MKLISWNVNGLRAVHKKGFLDWIASHKDSIICLQETKAEKDQLPKDLRELPGYQVFFHSAERRGYSGVAIYSPAAIKNVKTGMGIEKFDSEGRMLVAEYPEFTLLNIYFPNGGASPERLAFKMEFYNALLAFLDKKFTPQSNLIICGDVNTAHQPMDLSRPKENEKVSGFLPQERAWIDRLIEWGMVDTFRLFEKEGGHYSWWDYKTGARARNVGWRIDYFFVSKALKDRVKASYMLSDVMGSDHCPIVLELDTK